MESSVKKNTFNESRKLLYGTKKTWQDVHYAASLSGAHLKRTASQEGKTNPARFNFTVEIC